MIPKYFIKLYKFIKISPTRCSLEIDKNETFICICKKIQSIKNNKNIIPIYKVIWENENFIVFQLKNNFYMIEENIISENKIDIKKITMEG